MRILVLGGSRFVGRHFTDAAVEAGHEVTHFNRGQSSPPREDVVTIHGDRNNSLNLLEPYQWDWVLDTCGYLPRVVSLSSTVLKNCVQRYAFVSTISVYSDFSKPISEDSPLAHLDDPNIEEITGETYGGLKVLCETAVRDVYGSDCLIVRPGMIVGPHDPTDRFTYWVWRAAQGTPMVAPGTPDLPMQFIHARDLGNWMLLQMEMENTGTYNVTGDPTTLGEVLGSADVRYLPGDTFRRCGIEPGSAFAWFTEGKDEEKYVWDVDISRATAAGLTIRPISLTISETVLWANTLGKEYPWRSGLKAEDEERIAHISQRNEQS